MVIWRFWRQCCIETLMSALEQLETTYENLKDREEFKNEITDDLNNFVGRPSPLYFAKRWTEKLSEQKFT